MQAKTDEELYLLLRVYSKDYTPEAIKAASEEFSHRQLDEQTISRITASAEKALEEKSGKDGTDRMPLSDAKETAMGWGCLVLLCLVGYAIYGGYGWLDSIGWIAHQEDTTITARSDWLVGESKECASPVLNKDGAALLGKEAGYALYSVSCDDGPEHKMKVTFYGRKVQPEYESISWRCEREQPWFGDGNSFTCYQTGGER